MNINNVYDANHDATRFISSAKKSARKMATRYNQKKQAYVASSARLHKTGNLDMSRIARYRVSDEIFDKKLVTNSGKSHGLVCALDFSWSMDSLLIPMAKQLLILSLFCKYAKVKFQFFSFTTSESSTYSGFKLGIQKVAAFNNIGSDTMNEAELIKIFYDIYTLGLIEADKDDYIPKKYRSIIKAKYQMGTTPLTAAQYQAFLLAREMQNQGIQNVTSLIINDGDNNEVFFDDIGNEINVIEDPYTKRIYYDDKLNCKSLMSPINRMSRDNKINTLNLFLGEVHKNSDPIEFLTEIISMYQDSTPGIQKVSKAHIENKIRSDYMKKFNKDKIIDIKNLMHYNNVFIANASMYNIDTDYKNLDKINKLGQLISDELTKDFKII